ncbi:hypothetical protein ABEB36_009704 [Hypothenemus hampei]|uniref:Globin domain-containing protein n=1 Tax=Hypothenemus hampei TaxID=57062 RepID=A0ABD1EHA0_HYPHA
MGNIISYLWGYSGRNDDPDPDTNLTTRDKIILKTTWKKLTNGKANLQIGMALFLNLFQKHPEYHQLFPFRDLPLDQLPENDRFKAHCITLMYAFSSIIENIDNVQMLEQLLAKQGVNHVSRNVPNKAYLELKEVLMDLFGKSLNELELATWKKFFDYGFGVMIKNADVHRNAY